MNFTKIKSAILFFLFVLNFYSSQAKDDSCNLRISLLTCTRGEDLYSTWGHSAIRVTDFVSNTDVVYNYGTFNFEEPGFYMKFIRGTLLYYLSTEDFQSFQYGYQFENRGITEQVLNLSCREKYNMLLLLKTNLLENNRYYKYDFTFDNCTTRLADLVEKSTDSTVIFGNVLRQPSTFRDLIYEYLNHNDKQWSKLGIDLLLGSRMDVYVTPQQSMFLPDYLMNTFDVSTVGGQPLIEEKLNLLTGGNTSPRYNIFSDPVFIFSLLFIFVVAGSFSKNEAVQKLLNALDGFLYFVTGLLGLVIIFMWTGTDHYMCKDNYNLLWAWPVNVLFAFYFNSKKYWMHIYFLTYSAFLFLLLVTWFWLPQHLNPAMMPILGIVIFRSFLFYKIYKTDESSQLAK
ncbi:DUF4105 domain-containing protein [soil metagenome]